MSAAPEAAGRGPNPALPGRVASARPVSWCRPRARRACPGRVRAVAAPHAFPGAANPRTRVRVRPAGLRLRIGRDRGETSAPGEGPPPTGRAESRPLQDFALQPLLLPFARSLPRARLGGRVGCSALRGRRGRGAPEPSLLPASSPHAGSPRCPSAGGVDRGVAGVRSGASRRSRPGSPTPAGPAARPSPAPAPAPAGMGVWSRVSTAASSLASRSRCRFPGNWPRSRVPISAACLPRSVPTPAGNALGRAAPSGERSCRHRAQRPAEPRRGACGTTTR